MQAVKPRRGQLWRYNYAVLMGGGYWILVLPLAASQVVTLWMMALASDFSQSTATTIAELMTPILGAFLVAHSMAPEYRSGIGAVLACKPVSMHRVVTMRVVIAMVLPLLLTALTLTICSVGLKPIEIGPPLLAALPPLWFLSMLALTCATLFRSAPAGFAMAAVLWALDVALGYGVNPFLSSRGLTAVLETDPLQSLWLYGKLTLVALGTLLFWLHGRILYRVCRPAERRDLTRLVAAAVVLMLAYCGTGAAASVGYAYAHRARLEVSDVVWLRRQMSVYGPVPVARLFGPAFTELVTPPPSVAGAPTRAGAAADETNPPTQAAENGDRLSSGDARVLQLRHALDRWPNSIWAPSIAFTIAEEQDHSDHERAARDYVTVADRYGSSPYAPKALARVTTTPEAEVKPAHRLVAARRLVTTYAHTEEAEKGAEYLLSTKDGEVPAAERLQAARVGLGVAARTRQPGWHLMVADELRKQGSFPEALQSAREARDLGEHLKEQERALGNTLNDITPRRPQIDAAIIQANTVIRELEGKTK